MSHVYILTATNRRVPRWFTEGLAVHEETQVSPEWGDRVSPEILVAIRDKKLLPVAKLDRGFIFPDYPAQVVVSYFRRAAFATTSEPMERGQVARHGSFVCAAQNHSGGHSAGPWRFAGRVR